MAYAETDLLTFKTRLENFISDLWLWSCDPKRLAVRWNVDLKVSILEMHLQKQRQEYDVVIVALSQLTEVANYSNVHWSPRNRQSQITHNQ